MTSTLSSPRSLADRAERNVALCARLPLRHVVGPIALGAILALVVSLAAGALVGALVGVVVAAVGVAVVLGFVPRTIPLGVERILGGRDAGEAEFPRLHNLVEGLAMSSGIEPPRLKVIDDAHANLAVSGPVGDAVLVATTGLLAALERDEYEAIVAEALVRIGTGDAELAARAAFYVCGPLMRNGPAREGRPMALVTPLASARARRLRAALGDQREMLGDLAAIDMTRYPPALGAALGKMAQLGTGVESATWGTAHVWIANPLVSSDDAAASRLNELFGRHDRLDHRVELMAEL